MNLINIALSVTLLAGALPGLSQAGRPALTPQPQQAPADSTATPAPPAKPAGTTPPPIVGSDYVIGPDDQLQVTVWENQALTGQVLVRPDGDISMPLVGDIHAAGLTPTQLGKSIADKVKTYVVDPVVNVAVLAVNSKQVIMVGEVNHVGPVQIRPGMTVLQAIVTAGGLTPFANKKKIYVLRGEPGKQQMIKFNYKRSLKSDDMLVEPGDRIVVP
jgi:polysaccharide export outer membrane protein